MNKLVAFDLEIAKTIPSVIIERNGQIIEVPDDFDKYRPLGITCAALKNSVHGVTTVYAAHQVIASMQSVTASMQSPNAWEAWADESFGDKIRGTWFTEKMQRSVAKEIVRDLSGLANDGHNALTWNGQFDFHTLAEESGMWEECANLALNHHIDLMFDVFCNKGWRVSLKAALAGMGLEGKTEGMDGAKAPEIWPTNPLRVIEYVSRDVDATMELAKAIMSERRLQWQSASGNWQCISFPGGKLRTVRECLELPVKDNSWMDTPISRESFFEWMGEYSPFV